MQPFLHTTTSQSSVCDNWKVMQYKTQNRLDKAQGKFNL